MWLASHDNCFAEVLVVPTGLIVLVRLGETGASISGYFAGKDIDMTQATDVRELDAAIHAFGEAWARGDTGALAAMFSQSYTHNDASGEHLKRDAWLAYAAKRAGRETRITFRNVETRIFGDLAVVTGFNDMSGGGVLNAEDNRDLSIAFTQVWRRENGLWLREAFQATPVLDAKYE